MRLIRHDRVRAYVHRDTIRRGLAYLSGDPDSEQMSVNLKSHLRVIGQEEGCDILLISGHCIVERPEVRLNHAI